MKALAMRTRYGDDVPGRIARFFNLKDDSRQSFLVEILGGFTMFLSSLSLLGIGGGPTQMALECSSTSSHNNQSALVIPESAVTADLFAFALVTGIATLLMGLLAKVPIVIGPALPFSISFKRLMCQAPALGRDGGLAANLVVGCVYLIIVLMAKRFNGFAAIPEDFRLGMAAGIAALIGVAAMSGARIMTMAGTNHAMLGSMESNFYNMTLTAQGDILRIPVLGCIGLILLVVMQVRFKKRPAVAWSILVTIFTIAVLSCIIRASLEPSKFAAGFDLSKVATSGPSSSIGTVPSFATWNATTEYAVFRYVLIHSIEKTFNSFATVTAVALLLVVSNLGYNKSVFTQAMNDSDKISNALLVDAVGNIVLAPFLNTVMITPFMESIAGIVAGTKSGLGAVVAGILYILTSPVIRPILCLFPPEALNPGIIYASIFAIRSVQYMDFRRPTLFFPGLLVLVLIPISFEIGMSASTSYLIMFFAWLWSKWWICITPQMITAFALSSVLIIARSTVTKTVGGLCQAIALVTLIGSIIALILYSSRTRERMKRLCRNRPSDRYFEEENNGIVTNNNTGNNRVGAPASAGPVVDDGDQASTTSSITKLIRKRSQQQQKRKFSFTSTQNSANATLPPPPPPLQSTSSSSAAFSGSQEALPTTTNGGSQTVIRQSEDDDDMEADVRVRHDEVIDEDEDYDAEAEEEMERNMSASVMTQSNADTPKQTESLDGVDRGSIGEGQVDAATMTSGTRPVYAEMALV